VSGSLDGVEFADAIGLGKALRDNPSLRSCIVNRLYAYSIGQHVPTEAEARLEQYQATLDKRGYRFDEMLRLIVTDPSFFSVQPLVATRSTSKDIPHRSAARTAMKGARHAD
jgi:hypothetical protein